jgi:predicted metal-dependent hydrolase
MPMILELDGVCLEVVRKNIKNLYLSVYPPTGRVLISAPLRMSLDTIRLFAISKRKWIQRHQQKMRSQERENPRQYRDHEGHYVWGKRFWLKVVEENAAPGVQMQDDTLLLRVRPGADQEAREAVVSGWYRQLLKTAVPPLIGVWEPRLSVTVNKFFVQRMKTLWGSCNPMARTIRLNTELAKKPSGCLEYIVLHEMAHLREPTHNARFTRLLDRFMPAWQQYRDLLNRPAARQEPWDSWAARGY